MSTTKSHYSNTSQLATLIADAALILLLLGVVVANVAQTATVGKGKKDPDSLVDQLERELADLETEFRRSTISGRYAGWLEVAERMGNSPQRAKEDGRALKQMANLFAKIEQTKYVARRFGLRVAKGILEEQFLQRKGSRELKVRADLKLTGPGQAELLLERAKLRSLMDAYQYGDLLWRELYLLIERFVQADQPDLQPEMHQFAVEAHKLRFASQKLSRSAYLRQEALLERLAGPSVVLLAHVDSVIDGATNCGDQCLRLKDQQDEFNLFTYPMQTEQGVRELIETEAAAAADGPLKGLELSYRETKLLLPQFADSVLAKVDEEDIGFQGMEFLEQTGVSFD